jgi:hypothetical protein
MDVKFGTVYIRPTTYGPALNNQKADFLGRVKQQFPKQKGDEIHSEDLLQTQGLKSRQIAIHSTHGPNTMVAQMVVVPDGNHDESVPAQLRQAAEQGLSALTAFIKENKPLTNNVFVVRGDDKLPQPEVVAKTDA